jgi:hypothetical protein
MFRSVSSVGSVADSLGHSEMSDTDPYNSYSPPAPDAVLLPPNRTIEPWLIKKGLDTQIVQRVT